MIAKKWGLKNDQKAKKEVQLTFMTSVKNANMLYCLAAYLGCSEEQALDAMLSKLVEDFQKEYPFLRHFQKDLESKKAVL
jgi:translation initiation factor 2 alpha subunit (eIF-2alpha)